MEGGEDGKTWLTEYLERKKATWPQALSGSAEWYGPPFEAYNVRYLPLHILLDEEGRIVSVNPRGPLLDRAIEEALD